MNKSICKPVSIVCGFTLICIGIAITTFFSFYKYYEGNVIQIQFEREICSCHSDCNIHETNGCKQFCVNEFNRYRKRQHFDCLSMNVYVQLKVDEQHNETANCFIRHIETGFSYPNLNLEWTNPEYVSHYKSFELGDVIHMYYNKEDNDCITNKYYRGNIAAGIVCIAIGSVFLLVYVYKFCSKYGKSNPIIIPAINPITIV
jgi:hypothetical protein